MRMIFDIKKKYLMKKSLFRKILISFIATLFLINLFSTTLLASSDEPASTLAVDNIASDSISDTSKVDNIASDSISDTSEVDNIASDSISDTSEVDNIASDSVSDTSEVDNIPSVVLDTSEVDNIPSDSVSDTSDLVNVAPNERVVPIEEIESIVENTLGDLPMEEEKEITTDKSMSIDGIKFTPAKNLEEVEVVVIKLKDKPIEIIDPPKKNISVYNYLDIKLISNDTYVEEDDIKSLEFEFKVEVAWINNNKIDKGTIRLIRYHDGEWQNLSTTLISENETYLYYTTESPGCSTFAVVGSKIVENSESYVTDKVSIPWTIICIITVLLIIILVIVLFKARYIYF